MQGETTAAAELTFYDWQIVIAFALLSGLAAMALAMRDGQYRDIPHLGSIGFVGSTVGLAVIGGVGHFSGGIVGYELLLLLVSAGSGLGGRLIERAVTRKAASVLGLELDHVIDSSADIDRPLIGYDEPDSETE